MTSIFKAHRIDGKGWVFGYFVKYPDGLTVIHEQDKWLTHAIDESTLCRSIDAEDKNGNPLFTNDMIDDFGGGLYVPDTEHPDFHPMQAFPPTKVVGDTRRVGIIVEEGGRVCIRTKEMSYSYNISSASPLNEMELIGNIYDEYNSPKE